MLTVNIHDAKTNLSKLIDNAVKGESFIIAKAGKPLVKVVALAMADAPKARVGFMKGQMSVPADFDEFGRDEIEGLFSGRS
ncbi:type II toxin-antitoxin system Phd/YefM family antitoxin [Phenylobacterium sp.]|uniref:type II toxin-antitoxin system Phd/YefM family antitoxin n=1 Tax=Phenylobacterium sp. TaxID=1871053 RepID=UPI003D2AC893